MVLQLQRHPCRVLRQSRNMLQWGSHPGTDFQWVSNGFNDFHFKRVHMSRITQGSQVHNVTSTYLSGRFRWQGTGNVWICVNMCDMLWFLVLFIGFRGDYQLTSADISWQDLNSLLIRESEALREAHHGTLAGHFGAWFWRFHPIWPIKFPLPGTKSNVSWIHNCSQIKKIIVENICGRKTGGIFGENFGQFLVKVKTVCTFR